MWDEVNKTLRQYSLVKLKDDIKEEEYPNLKGRLIFLGEIPNIPGHCVIVLVLLVDIIQKILSN
jgi:hypothetical protein